MLQLINKDEEVATRLSFGFDFSFSATLFGWAFDFAFDLFDWQLNTWEELPIGMAVWIGPFYFSAVDSTIHSLDEPDKKDIKINNLTREKTEALTEVSRLVKVEEDLNLKYRQALQEIEKLRKVKTLKSRKRGK